MRPATNERESPQEHARQDLRTSGYATISLKVSSLSR